MPVPGSLGSAPILSSMNPAGPAAAGTDAELTFGAELADASSAALEAEITGGQQVTTQATDAGSPLIKPAGGSPGRGLRKDPTLSPDQKEPAGKNGLPFLFLTLPQQPVDTREFALPFTTPPATEGDAAAASLVTAIGEGATGRSTPLPQQPEVENVPAPRRVDAQAGRPELAVALKVSSDQGSAPGNREDSGSGKSEARALTMKETRRVADREEPATPLAPTPGTAARANTWSAAEAPVVRAQAAGPEAPRPVEPVVRTERVHLEEPTPKATPTLKSISLQVGPSGQQKVEVHVGTRSGELLVALRSGDTEIARGLREGLPELVSNLDQSGFRSEGWRPGGMVSAASELSPLSSNPADPGANDFQQQQQPGGSPQHRDHAGQNRSHRPEWLDEFESSPSGGKLFAGDHHGFSR